MFISNPHHLEKSAPEGVNLDWLKFLAPAVLPDKDPVLFRELTHLPGVNPLFLEVGDNLWGFLRGGSDDQCPLADGGKGVNGKVVADSPTFFGDENLILIQIDAGALLKSSR